MTQHMIINANIKLAPPTPQAPLTKDEIDQWADGLDAVLGLTSTPEPTPTPQPQAPHPIR